MAVRIQNANSDPNRKPEEAGDLFNEVIVKQAWSSAEYLKVAAIFVGWLLLLFLLFYFFQQVAAFFLIIIAGAGYGSYILITMQSKEYEYIATNGALDIDCIVARRKRKRVFSVEGADLESFGPADTDSAKTYAKKNLKVLDCGSRAKSVARWYIVGRFGGENYLVYIDAQEKIINNLRRFNPAKLARNY